MVSLFMCVVLGLGHVSAGAVPDPLGCRLEENGKAKMVGAVLEVHIPLSPFLIPLEHEAPVLLGKMKTSLGLVEEQLKNIAHVDIEEPLTHAARAAKDVTKSNQHFLKMLAHFGIPEPLTPAARAAPDVTIPVGVRTNQYLLNMLELQTNKKKLK